MIGDVSRALSQVFDRRFLSVLVKALAATLALLIGFLVLLAWLVGLIPEISYTLPWIGEIDFFDEAAEVLSFGAGLLLSAFLMFPVAAVFIGFFLDEIADAVEARHYPHLPPPRRQGWGEIIATALRFTAILIAANLVALIFYAMATVFAPLVFWAVNGYLLGREYFELVALRRMEAREAEAMRKRHLPQIWIAGVLMAAPLSVPLLNLVAPIVGVAAFVHLFHRLSARAARAAPAHR